MSSVDPLQVRVRRGTRFAELQHIPVCSSTQDLAAGASGNLAIWADEQLAGRGRNARVWHGAVGRDVEVSFRAENIALDDPATLAAAIPSALAVALEAHAGRPIRMKWPNDLYVGGRKLAGVLIDAAGNPPSTYVIGVGINANRTEFPHELADAATSLALLTGRGVDREALVLDISVAIHNALAQLEQGALGELGAVFANRLGLVGRHVRIRESERAVEGVLQSIDLQHAVLEDGTRVRLARVQQIDRCRAGEAGSE